MDKIHASFEKQLEYVYCDFFKEIRKILIESYFPMDVFYKYLGMNPKVSTKFLSTIEDKDYLNYFIGNKAFTEDLFNFMKHYNWIIDSCKSDVISQSWITCDFIMKNKIFIGENIVKNQNLSFDDLIYLKKKKYFYIHWRHIMEFFKIPNEMVSKYPYFDWERYFMELYSNINISNSFFDHKRFHKYLKTIHKCTFEKFCVNRQKYLSYENENTPYYRFIPMDDKMLEIQKRVIEKREKDEKDVPWDLIFEYPNLDFWKMNDIFETIPWYFDIEKGKFYAHLKEFSLELNRFIDGLSKISFNLKSPIDTPKEYLQQMRISVIKNLIKKISFTDEQIADEFKKFHACKKIVRQIESSYLNPEYTCCVNRLKREFVKLQNEMS